jgi:hypothetical protein
VDRIAINRIYIALDIAVSRGRSNASEDRTYLLMVVEDAITPEGTGANNVLDSSR